jgi:hypothetical protein
LLVVVVRLLWRIHGKQLAFVQLPVVVLVVILLNVFMLLLLATHLLPKRGI